MFEALIVNGVKTVAVTKSVDILEIVVRRDEGMENYFVVQEDIRVYTLKKEGAVLHRLE